MRTLRVVLTLVAVLLLFTFALPLIAYYSEPAPRELRLGNVKVGKTRCLFLCPDGSKYTLLIGVPRESVYSPTGGHFVVATQAGCAVMDRRIETNDLVVTSWLSRQKLAGTILSGWTNDLRQVFGSSLTPGMNYTVELSLSPPPPDGSSLWLWYLRKTRWPLFGCYEE